MAEQFLLEEGDAHAHFTLALGASEAPRGSGPWASVGRSVAHTPRFAGLVPGQGAQEGQPIDVSFSLSLF